MREEPLPCSFLPFKTAVTPTVKSRAPPPSLSPSLSLMANAVSSTNGYEEGGGNGGGGGSRPPRLPRWTRQEILVLIQGKKVAESRGGGRLGSRAAAAALVRTGQPAETKWATVSSYCRRHGVNRGPVQCRKRWSNLAGDYKKIKEWECRRRPDGGGGGGEESFWGMRNDLRRERKLPGFFDREVFDILDGAAEGPAAAADEEEVVGRRGGVEAAADEEEAVFDSGRTAGEDGLFSDFEQEQDEEEGEEKEEEEDRPPPTAAAAAAAAVTPISEKKFQLFDQGPSELGTSSGKEPTENPEKGSTSREGQKRRRTSLEEAEYTILNSQLIEVLERNSRMLTAQLEYHNMNCQLDRDQRKDHADSLVAVLSKLADALGKIADKL